jgi:hypothetical protein
MLKRVSPSAICLGFVAFAVAAASAQSVSERNGRIFFADQNGVEKPITNGNLDSQPYLSFNSQKVVFVRRKPSVGAGTGMSELWIAFVDGSKQPQRILSGENYIEGSIAPGFQNPKFSPEATRVYFEANGWATAAAIKVLDVATGKTKLLFAGLGVDVIRTGQYRGFLIGIKDPITQDRGRIMVYWLLDPNGKEVMRIGETDSDLDRFKRMYDIH